jgi:hypothetical protein
MRRPSLRFILFSVFVVTLVTAPGPIRPPTGGRLPGERLPDERPTRGVGCAGGGQPAAGPYRATRDMKRLQGLVRELPAEAWEAVVVELNHLSPPENVP